MKLQELLRDRRNILDASLKSIEGTYEHILQETSTELNELESSIRNKNDMVQRLQDEVLVMTVRKEMLAKAMEQINENHQVRLLALHKSRLFKVIMASTAKSQWLIRVHSRTG